MTIFTIGASSLISQDRLMLSEGHSEVSGLGLAQRILGKDCFILILWFLLLEESDETGVGLQQL